MLDDLKLIHHRDTHDLLGLAGKQARQLAHAYELSPAAPGPEPIQSVVFAGSGAMAYGAELVKAWRTVSRPMEIIRDYRLPSYAGPGTLCIVAGGPDDADAAADVLSQARAHGAGVVAVAANSRFAEATRAQSYPTIELPAAGRLPAPWPALNAVAAIFDAYGLTADVTVNPASEAEWLAEHLRSWSPVVPAAQNLAKQIAQELMGKSAVIYAGPELFPAAQHWKTAINRYAGQLAWCGRYPEFLEAELTGWSRQPVRKPYAIVELRSHQESNGLQRQFAASHTLLSGRWPAPHTVQVAGDSIVRRFLYATALGDFAAIYLALLNNVDPGDTTLAEKARQAASAL